MTQIFHVVSIIFYNVRNELHGYQCNCSLMTTEKTHHCRQIRTDTKEFFFLKNLKFLNAPKVRSNSLMVRLRRGDLRVTSVNYISTKLLTFSPQYKNANITKSVLVFLNIRAKAKATNSWNECLHWAATKIKEITAIRYELHKWSLQLWHI